MDGGRHTAREFINIFSCDDECRLVTVMELSTVADELNTQIYATTNYAFNLSNASCRPISSFIKFLY